MLSKRFVVVNIIAVCIAILPATVPSATLHIAEKTETVVLRNVTVKDGVVTGEAVNNSKATVRDVQLQVLYLWLWKNEFRPGKDDPGRAVYLTLDKEIAPGQSVPFSYKPSPPLSDRRDGYFDTSVKVVGFTQVFPG